MINLNAKQHCSGCTACCTICPTKAIVMRRDQEGFFYPVLEKEKCINCKKCEEVCTFKREKRKQKEPLVYGLKHKNKETRSNSQSGGAFTALTDFVLEEEGIVYGCGFDENLQVIHKRTVTKEARDELRGSKYVQSNLKDIFIKVKQDVKSGKKIVFSGTPCQVAGLQEYLKKEDCRNLLFLDLLCYGVPSPKLWQNHLSYIGGKYKGKVIKAKFRDKQKYGWKENKETLTIKRADKEKKYGNKIMANLFYGHKVLRPSCYNCPYKDNNSYADITIADFWGIEDIASDFYDEAGISLVLLHNEKGCDWFNQAKKDVEWIQIKNQKWKDFQLADPVKEPKDRAVFWEEYEKYGYKYITKKYAGNSLIGKLRYYIKQFLIKMQLYEKYLQIRGLK